MIGRYQPEPNIPEGSGFEKYQNYIEVLPTTSLKCSCYHKKAGPVKKAHRLQFDSSNPIGGGGGGGWR